MNILELKITNVDSWDDAQLLRMLRNNCREFMTNHTELITREQQRDWWDNLDKENFKAYLFHFKGETIGYGVISTKRELPEDIREDALCVSSKLREEAEDKEEIFNEEEYLEELRMKVAPRDWVTGGVITGWRGKGFGERIFSYLIEQSRNQVWLEVREDNEPAKKLYDRLGFIWREQLTRELNEGQKSKEVDILVMSLGEDDENAERDLEELRESIRFVKAEDWLGIEEIPADNIEDPI